MDILTNEAKVKLNIHKDKLFAVMPNSEKENIGTVAEPNFVNIYTDSEWIGSSYTDVTFTEDKTIVAQLTTLDPDQIIIYDSTLYDTTLY